MIPGKRDTEVVENAEERKAQEYWQVTVVVDGALDLDEAVTTAEFVDSIIEDTAASAREDGLPTELFILHHAHEIDVEDCACIQYETDHHPDFEWNTAGAGHGQPLR